MIDDSMQNPAPRPDAPPQENAPDAPAAEAPASQSGEGPPPPLDPRDLRPEHFPTTASNDGRIAWIFAFLMCIPIPGVSAVLGYIAMIIVGQGQRTKNPVARAVGRRASIFGMVSLAAVLVFFLAMGTLLLLENYAGVDPGTLEPFWVIFCAPFGAWGLFVGPFTAFIIAIIAATDQVGELKARKIYARAGL